MLSTVDHDCGSHKNGPYEGIIRNLFCPNHRYAHISRYNLQHNHHKENTQKYNPCSNLHFFKCFYKTFHSNTTSSPLIYFYSKSLIFCSKPSTSISFAKSSSIGFAISIKGCLSISLMTAPSSIAFSLYSTSCVFVASLSAFTDSSAACRMISLCSSE